MGYYGACSAGNRQSGDRHGSQALSCEQSVSLFVVGEKGGHCCLSRPPLLSRRLSVVMILLTGRGAASPPRTRRSGHAAQQPIAVDELMLEHQSDVERERDEE